MKGVKLLKIVFWFVPILFLSVVVNFVTWSDWERCFLEGVAILLVLLIFVSQKPVENFLSYLPRPHKIILTVFFLLLVSAELLGKSSTTFPFVSFRLYSIPVKSSEVIFYKYEGLGLSGTRVSLVPAKLFPPASRSLPLGLEEWMKSVINGAANSVLQPEGALSGPVAVYKKLTRFIRYIFQDKPVLQPDEQKQALLDTFLAIGERYNRLHPNRPVSAVEVSQCSLDFRKIHPEDAVCKMLWHVEISEGGKK